MLLDGVDFGWSALLFPVTLFTLYTFSLALAFWLSALYVKYRDISHIWEIFLQALFYETQIIYPLQMIVAFIAYSAQLLMLSPIAVLFQVRKSVLSGKSVSVR